MQPNIDHAIEIFSAISEQLGPRYVAYWTLPNTVLTLCGARAYCDGVFWDNDDKGLLEVWRKELAESLEVVKKQTAIICSETSIEQVQSGSKYASFELITRDGLHYALTHTNLLNATSLDEVEAQTSAQQILGKLTANLQSHPEFEKYSRENLHHIAFGILVGYPDTAISESVLYWDNNDPFAEPLIDADIRGASYYMCPQPVYAYPRHLVADAAIVAHEKLWSGLLKDYYQSDFHKSLEKDEAFQSKLRELGCLR